MLNTIALIVLGSLVYGLLYIFIQDTLPYAYGKDERSYFEAAKLFWENNTVSPVRPIGMSILLGFPLMISDTLKEFIFWNTLLNFMLWMGSFIMIFNILFLQTNKRVWSLIGTSIFGMGISSFIHSLVILSEIPFIFFTTVFVYLLALFFQKKQIKHLIYAITVVLFLALIKPVIWYFSIAISMTLLVVYRKMKWRNKSLFVFFLMIGLLVFQMTSMKKQYGNYSLSYSGKVAWYYYLGSQAKALAINESDYMTVRMNRYSRYDQLSWINKSRVANEDIKHQLLNNTNNIIKSSLKNIKTTFTLGNAILKYELLTAKKGNSKLTRLYQLSVFQNKGYMLFLLINGLLLLFGVLSKRKTMIDSRFECILFLLSCYLFSFTGMVSTQGDRLTLIVQPLILICFISLSNKLFVSRQQ